MKREQLRIDTPSGKLKLIVLRPDGQSSQKGELATEQEKSPGILWIHGGGYAVGMAAMVHASCGKLLAEEYGAIVVSPEYRLALQAPYPAALEDCYAALLYMHLHADELGIDRNRIVVGGESAGGGLAVATCLLARDMGDVNVAMQIPLYPMLDCEDTLSSRDNHGKIWNTQRNHWGWSRYLDELYDPEDEGQVDNVPKYASPARETDFSGLPPCYTFVLDGEPFFIETLDYVRNLRAAGVDAHVDVFHGNTHAFDMFRFWTFEAKEAKRRLCAAYERVIGR